MKKILILIVILGTLIILGWGINNLEKTKWFIEINNEKYKLSDFKKFSVIIKMDSGVPLDEKDTISKYVEKKLLLKEKEVNNFFTSSLEVGERLKLFEKKIGGEEEYKKFLEENKITLTDVRNYFTEEVKINNFFKEKTKEVVLTDEDKEIMYAQILKHSSSPEAQIILQYEDRFEEELLQGKKNAYRQEYTTSRVKKAKVYINK